MKECIMSEYSWKKIQGKLPLYLMHPNGIDAVGHVWDVKSGYYEACPYGTAPTKIFGDLDEAATYLIKHGKPELLKET